MTRPSLLFTAKLLELLALCLWLGGLVAVGALVAPVAFGMLDRPEAGRVVGDCFRRLNWVGVICGGVMLGALAMETRAVPTARDAMRLVRSLCVAAGISVSLYLGLALFPRMDALRVNGGAPAPENAATFDRLHHRYERLGSLQVLVLFGALLGSAASISRVAIRGDVGATADQDSRRVCATPADGVARGGTRPPTADGQQATDFEPTPPGGRRSAVGGRTNPEP